MTPYSKWFSRMVWLGIVVNLGLGVASIAVPHQALRQLGQMPAPDQTFWINAAGYFLLSLALFYIPAAWNPVRYRANAWLAVVARAAGVILFFGIFPGDYPLFGSIDLAFLILQGPLLLLMAIKVPSPEYRSYG